MSDRTRRMLEAGKSLLILLLTCSALFLAGQIFFSSGTGANLLAGLLPVSPGLPPSSTPQSPGLVGVARPVRMAVVNSNGRYGVQYHDDDVDELFDALGSLLGEALGSAQAPVQTTRRAWEEALTGLGIYYEFPGAIPLSLTAAWLGEDTSAVALTAEASRIVLSQEEGQEHIRLFYVDAGNGSYYACETAADLRGRLDSYIPNGAFFVFQQAERYSGLDPDTLILSDPPSPPIYQASAGVDLGDEDTRSILLKALSFSSQSNAIYPVADGWRVRDGSDNLYLTDTGTVTYHSGQGEARYPVPYNPTRADLVEATGEIVWALLLPYCGSARVYLSLITQLEDVYTLTYSYSLSGAEVQLGQDGWCAQFTVRGGRITDYTLHIRSYTPTSDSAVLLPEYQAMAAMSALDAEGRKLLLRYYDGGGLVSPAWIAR